MPKENHEIWFEGVDTIKYPRTVLPRETDVLIVGGGITGITSAYLASKTGKKVVLLERDELGHFVTDCTTGFLTQIIDIESSKLIKLFGIDGAKLIFESHQKAIEDVERIINQEKIDCEFIRCSNYIYANNKKEERNLLEMVKVYKKLGVNAEYKKDSALKFNEFGYIEVFNQAKFNAIKYLTSLAKIAVKNGAIIAENTEVLNLIDKKDFVEVEVKNSEKISAKKVLSATYFPFSKPKNFEHKYNMYRSYVLEYKIPANFLIEGIYEDTQLPYHYFRVDKKNNFDRLIIGGADSLDILNIDHEIGAKIVREYTNKFFPNNNFIEIKHWSGYIAEPVLGLAIIGELKDQNIFYSFGFSGNGMTYSYIASKIFTDKLFGINNIYSKYYDLNNDFPWWKTWF